MGLNFKFLQEGKWGTILKIFSPFLQGGLMADLKLKVQSNHKRNCKFLFKVGLD